MSFTFRENRALPRLAWLASVESGKCTVEHGCLVETGSNFFVEGIWNGDFSTGAFHACESFFGSGAVRRGSDFVFVASSATVDCLYYATHSGRFVCSNSLPFLLSSLGHRLDPRNPSYARINDSIIAGVDLYERDIPTVAGAVRRLMHHNLVVRAGDASEEPKPLPPGFASYKRYYAYLDETLRGMIQNAKDPARHKPLRMLTTQSTGYDSTAINALARQYGIDLALSVAEPKEKIGYYGGGTARTESDSGADICRILGIQMATIDRRFFEKEPESEFLYWAGIHNCQDMNLHEVTKHTGDGAVLLTGVLGEMWYTKNSIKCIDPSRMSYTNDQVQRWDLSCHGLSEARLHAGYIHAAAPYIGARRRQDIFDIGNSEDMRSWSIGGAYDRPIPRRIGEEAGVPREAFGQTKLASVVEILPPYLPHGKRLRQEFFVFLRKEFGPLADARLRLAQQANYPLMLFLRAYDKARRILRARFLQSMRPVRRTRFHLGDNRKSALYVFCVNKTAEFYTSRRA
jgi:hypothetical protein